MQNLVENQTKNRPKRNLKIVEVRSVFCLSYCTLK